LTTKEIDFSCHYRGIIEEKEEEEEEEEE